jgi:hypothetical protein
VLVEPRQPDGVGSDFPTGSARRGLRVPALGSLERPGRSGPKASTAADHYGRSEATYGIKDSAQSVASWAIQRCSSVVSHGFAIGEGD